MFRKIKLFLTGLAFILLGVMVISLKFLLGDEARLPFWPFDGVAAIIGGIFIAWWSFKIITEPDVNSDEPQGRKPDNTPAQ